MPNWSTASISCPTVKFTAIEESKPSVKLLDWLLSRECFESMSTRAFSDLWQRHQSPWLVETYDLLCKNESIRSLPLPRSEKHLFPLWNRNKSFKVPMKWKIEVLKNTHIWKALKSEEEWCFPLCDISSRSTYIQDFCIMQIRYWWCHKVWQYVSQNTK